MKQQFDAGKIADDLQSLIHHAEELLRATADSASESATNARERAEESLSAVRARLADFQDEVKGRARGRRLRHRQPLDGGGRGRWHCADPRPAHGPQMIEDGSDAAAAGAETPP